MWNNGEWKGRAWNPDRLGCKEDSRDMVESWWPSTGAGCELFEAGQEMGRVGETSF